MGTNSSKDSKMNSIMNSLLGEYTIVQEVEDQNLLYLQEKMTQQEFLLREFNFTNRKACDQLVHKLKKLKSQLQANKHVVNLAKYQFVCEDGYCSKFFRVYALFKYPHRTLDDQITDRRLHQRRFLETELWSILASCILGLGHLQRNGIKHSAIKSTAILVYNDGFSNEGIIKVSVPFATAQQSIYDVALMKRSGKHLYLSPQLCRSLNEELIVPEANQYKSDTWALALTILEAGLLEYQDDIYRDDFTRINHQILKNKLGRFGQKYSDKLKKMLEVMLDPCQSSRPDWIELESHVAMNQTDQQGTINSRQSFELVSGKMNDYSTQSKPINFFSNDRNTQKNQFNLFESAEISPFAKPLNESRPSSVPVFTPEKQLFKNFQSPPFHQSNFKNSQQKFGKVFQNSHYSTNFGSQPGVNNILNGLPEYAVVRSGKDNEIEMKVYPSRINNLDYLRPCKNIFPDSTYITKTKPDQNLLMKINQEQDYSSYPSIQFNLSSQLSNPINSQIVHNGDISQEFITESYLPINSDRNQLQFVQEIYNMGSKYIGNKLNGQRHGQGKFYYQDGGMYDGQWKQNKMDGYGKLYYQSGKLAYEGNWKQDKFYGQGILYNETPDYLMQLFDFNNFEGIGQFWTKYEGFFINDLKHGKGTLYLSNGQKFCGNFELDVAQGVGVFTCADNREIRGIWSNNHKIG